MESFFNFLMSQILANFDKTCFFLKILDFLGFFQPEKPMSLR